ncbi:MAG: putative ABC transporter ATP-binding protein YbhF [Pelotomaculum sp. PtaB.Bin104]|nr:MAG: putative ABC transporter ATP-binding protein YbhF [Pelotomaculum sp. PtaB.Bin104]
MCEGSNKPVVRINRLTKRYGEITAVNQLSFEVNKGEIFGFLGPNGAGKTTTINMICGLVKPDAGEIYINGLSAAHSFERIKKRSAYARRIS